MGNRPLPSNLFLKGFGIYLPVWLSLDYKSLLMKVNSDPALLEQVPVIFGQPFGINVPAILIVVFITIVLVIGIRESSRVNTIMVVVKMAILLFFKSEAFSTRKTFGLRPFIFLFQ